MRALLNVTLVALLEEKKKGTMALPHALILPLPGQGHVNPLVELSHHLLDHGFKITFINTDFMHAQITAAYAAGGTAAPCRINLVSLPDGLESGEAGDEARSDFGKLIEAMRMAMPPRLQELIRCSKEAGDEITCVIADHGMAWALEIGRNMGLRTVSFCASSAATFAIFLSAPKLIEEGIIDENGYLTSGGTFQLAPGMLQTNWDCMPWNFRGDRMAQSIFFNYIMDCGRSAAAAAEFFICNSFQEIEAPVFAHAPQILPIGPLRATEPEKLVGHFWPEDHECVDWLESQPTGSVVYVAFGSLTVFDRRQICELAQGLQLCSRPFLWVVRPGQIVDGGANEAHLAAELVEGSGSRGKVVGWSPQRRVLAHPSVGCFVSHCGWNSTVEGVSSGVPFLCWPYLVDQFMNQDYICDVWKVGLKMVANSEGIMTWEEIRLKVNLVLGDTEMKARVIALKQAALQSVAQGGSSYQNLCNFAAAMKGKLV